MDSPLISVRVVNVDWYLSEESKLPVVRMFGSTPAGQRACLRLHGALPYFMVRPVEDDNAAVCSQFKDPESLKALLPQLESAVESAMAASSGRPGAPSASPQSHTKSPATGDGAERRRWEQAKVLARLEVVRGVPFYGYHSEEVLFVKVYVNNPALTGKVASVLQAGHVLSTRFQPYESHVPFLLQVFIDYNISGMSYVHLRNALFLQPLPERSSVSSSQPPAGARIGDGGFAKLAGVFTTTTVPENLVACFSRQVASSRSPDAADDDGRSATEPHRPSEPTSPKEKTDCEAHLDPPEDVARDLLAGISMSQLFSQPSSPKRPAVFRPYERPTPKTEVSPGKQAEANGKAPKRPMSRWWERQTTTELEITGTVDDVINPSLLAAGKAESGGKGMAVTSLRELWDEERERSRAAGGGSQLSAPPGLELADSQDAWMPPQGLLTQHMKGTVDDLARNVLRRNAPDDRRASPQKSSQDSTGRRSEGPVLASADLTPSGPGLSQGSATVASASSSPANYLPAPDRLDGNDTDQGLLDMLAALRGSQSQGEGLEATPGSPRQGSRSTQSSSQRASHQRIATPVSSADQAEAIAATQRRQEFEERTLGQEMALAAQEEQNYDSDGSDDYHSAARRRSPTGAPVLVAGERAGALAARASTPASVTTPAGTAGDAPPSSQRSTSFPPWSQRRADTSATRAATMPSQGRARAGTGASVRSGRSSVDDDENDDDADADAGNLDEGDGRHVGGSEAEALFSQLSSRSLDDLEESVRAQMTDGVELCARATTRLQETAPGAGGPADESSSELVGIMCSQVEVEHDHNQRASFLREDMNAIDGRARFQDTGDEMDGAKIGREQSLAEKDAENAARRKAARGHSGTDWTRGPVRLQYDSDDEDKDDGLETTPGQPEPDELQPEGALASDADDLAARDGEEGDSRDSSRSSPLRLRGGVGAPSRPDRTSATSESRGDCHERPVSADGRVSEGFGVRSRAEADAPIPGNLGRLRHFSLRSATGVDGPLAFSKAPSRLPEDDGGGSAATDKGAHAPARLPSRIAPAAPSSGGLEDVASAAEPLDSGDEGFAGTQERSQVIVPGWGSQGHHSVEYSESQLSFIPSSQLRSSPNLSRGRDAAGVVDEASTRHESPKHKRSRVHLGGVESAEAPGPRSIACAARGAGDGSAFPEREPPTAREGTALSTDGNVLAHVASTLDRHESTAGAAGNEPPAQAVSLSSAGEGGPFESSQDSDARHRTTEAMIEKGDLQRRWQNADARLRLAHGRASSAPLSPRRRKRGDDRRVFSPALSRPHLGSHAKPPRSIGTGPSGDTPVIASLNTSVQRQSYASGPSASEQTLVASPTSASAGVPSPTRADTRLSPTSTPPSPPSVKSPAPMLLSARSDQSDMPPLGQRTPAPRVSGAGHPAPRTEQSSSGHGADAPSREGGETSPLHPRVLLDPGSDSFGGSPVRERLSGTPPPASTPSPRLISGSAGAPIILCPRVEAPDPARSAEALARAGMPQVVHTEPYYSRKDDVPERPREFAGKVFRILHKDDLQNFDTSISRQSAITRKPAAATLPAGALSPSRRRRDDTPSLPTSPGTVRSPMRSPYARSRASSSRSSPNSPSTTPSGRPFESSSSSRDADAIAGISGRGSSANMASFSQGNHGSQQAAISFRGLEEWKSIAARSRPETSGAVRRSGSKRDVELVPTSFPPSFEAAATWSRANPSTSRRPRVASELDAPVLRSTRNALGVLAGGGEADLADDASAEISMVADVNTGQLVPVAVGRDDVDTVSPPATAALGGAAAAPTSKDSSQSTKSSSTPPLYTPSSSAGRVGDEPNTDRITPATSNVPAKRPTQRPHRPTNKSQISPTTQTPSSCPSEEKGARFAFGMAAGRDVNAAAAAADLVANSQSSGSGLGLSGGIVGRAGDGAGGDRLTVLSLEIHVQVSSSKRPDPRRDPVHAVCWRVKDSFSSAEREVVATVSGVIVLPSPVAIRGSGGGGSGVAAAAAAAACLKCGEPRDYSARAFCTFEGGGFVGQAGSGRATFCHGLGKGVHVLEVCSEAQLMRALVAVFCRHDPDFVVGWEVQGDSLGYIVERGFNLEPSLDMTRLLSRTPGREADKRNGSDEWGKTHGSGIWLTGRTVLNMWRLMRSELKLCSYTLQSVAEHVLRKRIPSFSLQLKSKWFSARNMPTRSRALAEPLSRAKACLAIMDKLDLLGRTSEMARLFGIDFFSVLSRGSQYRVEAVMLRVLKPRNFVAVSPSRQQVASQAAMESIPLVFEPRSRLYTSPVVVVDFQSLYPSMMIAYNLCYSTILAKFDGKTGGTSGSLGVLPYPEAKSTAAFAGAEAAHAAWARKRRGVPSLSPSSSQASEQTTHGAGTPGALARTSPLHPSPPLPPRSSTGDTGSEAGSAYSSVPSRASPGNASSSSPPPALGSQARKGWDPRCIHVAPNTAGFCHPSLRQGILPIMLREILETRVMIKGAMRRAEIAGQRVLARTLNARQFALKMISNVTYGYTAAGYSGRMPMAELADAIVESARQTLIKAARTVDNHKAWQASVAYGDTDSLFIELPGRSLEEAHRIGREMAAEVSRLCPPDVVLKFEKVYLPCILASKKRYVGHMYESPKDLKPSLDAKGIETVRRDGCPLLVKMLEKVLRLLFATRDLSQVKGYLYRQWTRILTDRAAVGDFIFAKEVRLGTYASDVYMPPSAIVASKAMANDPRAEPKYCERIPYVVVAGPVGARLMDLVVSPEQFLAEGSGLRLNGKYYITKVINPALDRALALVGVDVNAWYSDMPRPAPRVAPKAPNGPPRGNVSAASTAASGWGALDPSVGGKGKGRGGGAGGSSGGMRANMITNFFISDRCSLCGEQCARSVCGKCAREPAANGVALFRRREAELGAYELLELCRHCTGHAPSEVFGPDSCGSLECPVFFERHRAKLKIQDARELCTSLRLVQD